MYPLYGQLTPRLGRSGGAVLTTVLVLLLIVVPVWLISAAIVREGGQAVPALQSALNGRPPEWLTRAWGWLQGHVPELAPNNLMESLSAAGQQIVKALASTSGAVLGGVALVLVQLIITLFALFFFLRDAPKILRHVRAVMPFRETERDRVLKEVGDLIFASVIAGLVVASLQGALGGIAFWLIGIRAPVVWGTIMAFFALIPVAGAWVIWLPVALWLLATGDITRGLVLIGIGAGIIGTVDNILRPIHAERPVVDERIGDVHRVARRRRGVRLHRTGLRARRGRGGDGAVRPDGQDRRRRPTGRTWRPGVRRARQ